MVSSIGTPLNIGLGLYVYHTTRSKELINFFSDLNVSSNYKRVTSIKKDIMQAVQEQKIKDNGIFIPSTLECSKPVFFAIDNVDLARHT